MRLKGSVTSSSQGFSVVNATEDGIVDGMMRAGDLYDKEEYFISELLSCADAMKRLSRC